MVQQSSIFSGENPLNFNSADPIPLFILQTIVIVVSCRLLGALLAKIRQPRVISEVIVGILLGPSVMGRIPGFKRGLFPDASIPMLTLASNIGLIFFLFLVGLELDPRVIRKNLARSVKISFAGMAFPFAFSIAVSYGLYKWENTTDVSFGNYLLFIGVAMSITAFPVLARILTELNLLKTPVGSITISAAAVDDASSWCLLALVVALINSSTGLVALYILLTGVGYVLFLVVIVRPLFIRFLKYSGTFESGPSEFVVFVTLSICLVSAFFTDIIGIHAIFGGFVAGTIMPHEGGFARRVSEKLEDLVMIVFLPIYFTLSGLKTQLGLLDSAKVWGLTLLVIFFACLGKITGCSLFARSSGLVWREALAVGVLMNCKGLVELIVLNVGLDAHVIDRRTFVIMVVMALITTCITTPLALWIYPPSYQRRRDREVHGGDKAAKVLSSKEKADLAALAEGEPDQSNLNLLVCLNKIQHIPAMMTLIRMLQPVEMLSQDESAIRPLRSLKIFALRMIELTTRTSGLLSYIDSDDTIAQDPILNVFRTFGQLNGVDFNASLTVCDIESFADKIAEHSEKVAADLVILPWKGHGSIIEDPFVDDHGVVENKELQYTSPHHAAFMQNVFRLTTASVGVLVDRGFGLRETRLEKDTSDLVSISDINRGLKLNYPGHNQKVFMPFFGGSDDREALTIVLGLSDHSGIEITVVRYIKSNVIEPADMNFEPKDSVSPSEESSLDIASITAANKDKKRNVYLSGFTTPLHSRTVDDLNSQNADEKLLEKFFGADDGILARSKCVKFEIKQSVAPFKAAVDQAMTLGRKDLVVVGRSKLGGWNHVSESAGFLRNISQMDRRKILGELAEGIVATGCVASVLVVQARKDQQSRISAP